MNPTFMDRDGLLWFKLYPQGLGRYDGENMTTYKEAEGFGLTVSDIVQDRAGYLWVGGLNTAGITGYLARSSAPLVDGLNPDSLTFDTLVNGSRLLTKQIIDLVTDPAGNVWASNESSTIIRYSVNPDGTILPDTISKNLEDITNAFIAFDEAGRTYMLNNSSSKLYRLPADYKPGDKIEEVKVFGHADLGGVVIKYGKLAWVSSTAIYIAPVPPAGKLGEITESIQKIAVKSNPTSLQIINDSTMLTTTNDKLLDLDINEGKLRVRYDHLADMGLPTLLDVFLDRQRNIWVGTVNGIARLPTDYQAYTTPNESTTGLSDVFTNDGGFQAAMRGGPNNEWLVFGTTDGLVIRSSTDEWQHIGEAEGFPLPIVLGLAVEETTGRIWAGTNAAGINVITPKKHPHYYTEGNYAQELFGYDYTVGKLAGFPSFFPKVLPLVREEGGTTEPTLFFGNSRWVIMNTDDQPWFLFRKPTGLGSNVFNFFTLDNQQRLLSLDIMNGLHRSIEPFTYEESQRLLANGKAVPSGRPIVGSQDTAIFERIPMKWQGREFNSGYNAERHQDELWVGVNGGALILDINNLEAKHFIDFGDSLNTPADFEFDPSRNRVWVATDISLYEVDLKEHRLLRRISEKQGLKGEKCLSPNCLALDAKGVLYFTTTKGLAVYRPDAALLPKDTFNVYVRSNQYTETSWGKNEAALSFASLNYREEDKLYQTKLDGYDEDWSATTRDAFIRYTNLPAYFFSRTYKFRVRSARDGGSWIENQVPAFITVSPPWYFRWWAVLIGLGLLALAIRQFVRFRLKQLADALALQDAAVIKQQRDEIKQKNDQNELLLKEIHHRVKNNLEVVSSLLELQSAGLSDSEARDAMQAGQSRVQSMGLLHQKLYQGDNLAAIEMKDYFHNLAGSLLETYEAEDRIKVNINMEALELDVDTAVPLGLIVNELLTNVIKYAFEDSEEGAAAGAVEVGLSKQGTGYLLRVTDNGAGKDFDTPAMGTGFGTRLVSLLSRQLGGTLTEVNDGGLKTELRFAADQ
ncbi:MAG: histidine kinase dimerization/phosphoacceptor domain -containing protein [Lewinella sp.]